MITRVLGGLTVILIIILVVIFSLLREVSANYKKALDEKKQLTQDLTALNLRIEAANRIIPVGQSFKNEVKKINEKNSNWADTVVPVDVVNGLCAKANCTGL